MTDSSPDLTRLTGAVAGLFDHPATHSRTPTWRAWTPDELLLFESEDEDVARLLVVLLAAQLGSRRILLESPDGVDQCCHDGRWEAIPDDKTGDCDGDRTRGAARRHLRLIVMNGNRRGA